jgi:hypothetical protein
MKTQRAWLLFGALLVVAILAYYFIRQLATEQNQTGSAAAKAKPSSELKNVKDINVPANHSAITQSVTSASINSTPVVNDRQETNEIRQYMELQNKPIEFYGLVIDQNNNPIVGAKVQVEVRHLKVVVPAPWGDEDQIIPIEKETDSNGHFEIDGVSGDSLTIKSVEKAAYKLTPKMEDIYSYGGVPKPYHPDPQNPVIIRMWKLGKSANLISHRTLLGFEPDGRIYTLDLVADTKKEGDYLDGDLRIQFQRDGSIRPKEEYPWSLEISAIDGGFIETTDEFEYLAPENGYQPQIMFKTNSFAPRSMPDLTKDYYFTARHGRVHGVLHLQIFSDYNGKSAILIDSRINPNGSRNLQP